MSDRETTNRVRTLLIRGDDPAQERRLEDVVQARREREQMRCRVRCGGGYRIVKKRIGNV